MREMVSQLYYDTVTYGSTFASEGEGREGITGGANRFGWQSLHGKILRYPIHSSIHIGSIN